MKSESSHGDDLVLVIDQGGHSTRCLVFDKTGTTVAEARRETETSRPAARHVEQDATAVMRSVRDVLAEVGSTLGTKIGAVASAALCTQRSSIVCWSRTTGEALSPVISWQDTRAEHELASLALDANEVSVITGLQISAHYGASKMRWCLENLAPVRDASSTGDLAMGPLASYLIYGLSKGKTLAVDPSNGSRTLLYDVENDCWSPKLLAAFGVNRELLPAIQPNRSDWASIVVDRHSIPLVLVNGDQSAVPYAFTNNPRGLCFLNLGTGAFLQCPVSERVSIPGLLNSLILRSSESTDYSVEGTVNGAAAALTWFADSFGMTIESLLSALPGWQNDTVSPPLFINTVGGVGSPFWKPGVAPRFAGQQNSEDDVPAKAIAVVESIAFLIAANLFTMRQHNVRPDAMIVSGGLSKLDVLLQRIAELSPIPVRRSINAEATAYGAARLCQPGLPVLDCDAQIDAAVNPGLRQRYEEWSRLMLAL